MEKRFQILSSEFEMPVQKLVDMPKPSIPEIAFVGRSNVGKSSLLNSFTERQALARTSKTPGRTQAINFFRVGFRSVQEQGQDPNGESFRYETFFVDLPGYGYAAVSKKQKAQFRELIENYLLRRVSLEVLLLLIDSRRDPGEEERWISNLGSKGKLYVMLTKVDKLTKNERGRLKQKFVSSLGLPESRILLVSRDKPQIADPRVARDMILASVVSAK